MLARTPPLAVVAVAASVLTPASALALDQGHNLLQSRSNGLAAFPGGQVNTTGMGRFAASENACRVVFQSSSDGLMSGDNDRVQNVYVRDTCGSEDRVILVSKAPDGTPADADSSGSAISPNGRYVAFGTRATNLGGGDVSNAVYRYDLQTGELVAVSRTTSGTVASGIQHATPSVSSKGDVAFTTTVALDPARDKNTIEDVYVRRADAGGVPTTTELVSRGAASDAQAVGGTDPSISGDGWAVGFTTAAGIAAEDTNGANDVYRRSPDHTILVSRTAAGAAGGGRLAAVDNDGSDIAFVAAASAALDAKDTNGKQDVYRWHSDGTMTLVSRYDGADTAAPNGNSFSPAISATGTVVSFASEASDLTTPAQTGLAYGDVFRRDLSANTTTIMSRVGPSGADFAEGSTTHALSTDGQHSVMLTGSDNVSDADEDDFAQIYARSAGGVRHVNRPPGTAPFTNGGVGTATSTEGAISADGRFVAFVGDGNGLVDGDNDRLMNIYVRDNKTNVTEQVNVTSDERQGTTHSSEVAISDDGRYVAFVSRAALTDDDLDSQGSNADVFVRDREAGTTVLVSKPAGTGRAVDKSAHYAEEVAISGDGKRVAFSTALALTESDTNGRRDVYVREIGGEQRLWLATPGTVGEDPTFGSMRPSLDRDGSVVAFVSTERLDETHDPVAGRKDVYVRDLDAGTTELVSRSSGAGTTAGTQEATGPSISADGNRVAFESRSQISPGANGQLLVHIRDRAANETLLASRGPGHLGPVPNAAVTKPSLSADGKRLVYQSAATNIGNGEAPLAGMQVWYRDLTTGGSTLVSRWGAGGAPGTADSTSPALSANGRCVAFTSLAPNMGLEHKAGDYSQVWVRAHTGACPDVVPPFTSIGGPEGPTQNASPQFFLNSNEDGVTFECKLGDGEWAACSSPHRLTNLADGDYTLSVRGTDLAGNVETAVKTRSFTVDTTKPVVTWTDSIDSVSGDATPTVAFAVSEAGVELRCQVDGEDVEPCASPLTLPQLAEGSHELTIRAVDAAGNVGDVLTAAFAVDLTGAVAEITGGPASTTADTTPTFTFGSEDGATFRCGVDTTQLAACTSPWTSSALKEGAHTFRVQAIDPHGTPGPVVERTFVVDLPDPPKPQPRPEDPRPSPGDGPAPTPPATGSGPSTSTPRAADQPGGQGARAVVRLAGRSAKVRRGRLTLTLRCTGADCRGTLVLKAKAGRKTVVLGRASYRVTASRTAKVTVKLSRAGRTLLKRGKRVKATADLGGTTAKLTIRG